MLTSQSKTAHDPDIRFSPTHLSYSLTMICRVIADHESKIASDPIHAMVEADMRDIQSRSKKAGIKVSAVFDPARLRNGAGRHTSPSQLATAGLLAAFDANTVEAVLLASAILLCVAGIMFSSDRFSGSLLQYYQSVCIIGT